MTNNKEDIKIENVKTMKDNDEIQFISFKLDGKYFGLKIDMIKEILKVSEITSIPNSPDYLTGLINVRGNIIPVLDPKKKLNLLAKNTDTIITERTKILIVIIAGIFSGIIVDEVLEVRKINSSIIKPPPQITLGIDKFFLTGVIKLKEEKELILMLNLKELLNIEIDKIKKITDGKGNVFEFDNLKKQKIDELQVVTFLLGTEEFGIEISNIKEILKVQDITSVPNVPFYVKGIQNIRDLIIPVIDMRKIVNIESIEKSTQEMVEDFRRAHINWVENLKNAILQNSAFTKSTDPSKCELGIAITSSKTHSYEVRELYEDFKPHHDGLHLSAVEILNLIDSDQTKALYIYNNKTLKYRDILMGLFDKLEYTIKKKGAHEQRIIVIDINNVFIGLLVDKVSEVLRISRNIIDTGKSITSIYGNEIKGIAKIDEGKRLILVVDEKQLISSEDVNAISNIHKADEELKSEKEDRVEKQYVVFSILDEEYGISIDKVQEIFKVEEITNVPRSAEFIKGITNLRGSIIPVIDIKKRFGIDKNSDKKNRLNKKKNINESKKEKILVVKLKDITVGILVNNVSEVLKIWEDLIVDAPALVVSHIDTGYLEGIAKLDNGDRIILILDINNLMNEQEYKKLKNINEPEKKKKLIKKKELEKIESFENKNKEIKVVEKQKKVLNKRLKIDD